MKRYTCIGIIKLYTKEILQNDTIEVSNRNCYCQSVELNIPQELTVPLPNLSKWSLLRPFCQVPSQCRQWNDGSNDRAISFTPISICTCTSSISSYRTSSVRMDPMVAVITECEHIFPQHLALFWKVLLPGFRHWYRMQATKSVKPRGSSSKVVT